MRVRMAMMVMMAIGLVATPAAATRLAPSGAMVVRMPVDPTNIAFADCATPSGHAVCGAGQAADILFVDIADPARAVSTGSFSLLAAEGGATLTAYDAAGRLIGSARGTGDGTRVTLVGEIARIAVRPAVAVMPAAGTAMSHVPEPATWAMLLMGFVMIAGGVRRCIRRSEARFSERIRRIAAGEPS